MKVDLQIISRADDSIKEQIRFEGTNGYFESNTGKKVIFLQWSPPKLHQYNDQSKTSLQGSIKRFVSISLKQVVLNCAETIRTIRYSTKDWEKYRHRKQLVEFFVHELKHQLTKEKYSQYSWQILFICDDHENGFFQEFYDIISNSQTEKDTEEQCYYQITSMHYENEHQ